MAGDGFIMHFAFRGSTATVDYNNNYNNNPTLWQECKSYEQLLPTKVYYSKKIASTTNDDLRCRMCTKKLESVSHVLAGTGMAQW